MFQCISSFDIEDEGELDDGALMLEESVTSSDS